MTVGLMTGTSCDVIASFVRLPLCFEGQPFKLVSASSLWFLNEH